MKYSVHVCVLRPTPEELDMWEGNPEAGWLNIYWPEELERGKKWFGAEENCAHGYCGRIAFDNDDPEGTVEDLEAIRGILAAMLVL